MLISIGLTAATVCTERACTKRLNETQWPETRDETLVRLETVSRPRRLDRDHIPVSSFVDRRYCALPIYS